MITRAAKIFLIGCIGFFYLLVVFNNLTDFDSNYQFVRHVLSMDTTFAGNHGMWRAIPNPIVHTAFYCGIISWETLSTLLFSLAVFKLLKKIKASAEDFNTAKRVAIVALTLSLAMWMIAFLSVGAEWFLMWQSHTWNGQEAAFRMFAIVGIVFIVVLQPEREGQP